MLSNSVQFKMLSFGKEFRKINAVSLILHSVTPLFKYIINVTLRYIDILLYSKKCVCPRH